MLWQAKTEAQRQGVEVEEEKLGVGEQCSQEPGVGVDGGLADGGLWGDRNGQPTLRNALLPPSSPTHHLSLPSVLG